MKPAWTRSQKMILREMIITVIFIVLFVAGAALGKLIDRCFGQPQSGLETSTIESTITVYSDNGKVIRTWSGTINRTDTNTENKVVFELDGQQKEVYNAIVIIEEED